MRYSMELHGSPCYCPILGFSSACGLAHRTAPSHPCLAWGSRGWRCVAGTQKWAANCWHLEGKRSINQIIWSPKQGCPGEWHRGGPYGAWHRRGLAKMMRVYFVWRAQILMVLERTKAGLSTSNHSPILHLPSSEVEALAVTKWADSKPTPRLPFVSRNQALL